MYIHAHPFGYTKQKTNRSKRIQCRNTQCTRVQTIIMSVPMIYPVYDNQGHRIGSVETTHTQTKNVYHTDISHKHGYTLAESYWNSVVNSPNYGAFTNKFRKKDKSLAD